MKRINVRPLLLFFSRGCFALIVLTVTLVQSQDRPKKMAPPLAPLRPRTDVLRTATDIHVFNFPTIGPSWVVVRLDWCREWSANCGKPAADAYCDSMGFLKAGKFEIQEHVGHTATIGDLRSCDGFICNGFKSIECMGLHTVFDKPRITAYDLGNTHVMRMDWCLDWAANCGKPAADYFCKLHDFPRGARSFEIARNAGPTRTVRAQKTCPNPNCDGFKVIECEP